MGVGLIKKSVLIDIANAIRAKGGEDRELLPGEMAAQVAALSGGTAGSLVAKAQEGSGLVSDTVLSAIAEAIRGQNGLSVRAAPFSLQTWTGIEIRYTESCRA